MTDRSKPFIDTLSRYLDDPAEASAYLDAVLESGDTGALLVALRDVVTARGGMGELSRASGLNRKTLYRTLSEEGNPTLDTLARVLDFNGLRVSVLPADAERAAAGRSHHTRRQSFRAQVGDVVAGLVAGQGA